MTTPTGIRGSARASQLATLACGLALWVPTAGCTPSPDAASSTTTSTTTRAINATTTRATATVVTTIPATTTTATTTASAATCQRTLTTYPVLRPGDRGPAVGTLQCLLNDADLGPVVVDGSYGPQTRAAVLRVARGTEGTVDTSGRVERSMWTTVISRALSGRTLRTGSTGADVVTLQRALRAQGYVVVVDGLFGSQTAGAIKRFQTETGNIPDGVVGPSTIFALKSGGSA